MMVAILYEDKEISPKALFQAGLSFDKTGDKEKSLSAFRELLTRYPDSHLAATSREEIRRIQSEKE